MGQKLVDSIALEKVVPHRAEMLLLTRIVSHDSGATVSEVTVTDKTVFVEEGGVPAWVGVEYMAQTVAAHDGLSQMNQNEGAKIGFLISMRKSRFYVDFFPIGKKIYVIVSPLWGEDEFFSFEGKIVDPQSGSVLAQSQLNLFRPQNLNSFKKEKKL